MHGSRFHNLMVKVSIAGLSPLVFISTQRSPSNYLLPQFTKQKGPLGYFMWFLPRPCVQNPG